ncbi:MAG: coproporphyrinogen dehydrogenase HemZ [Clostridia bacterium]|nr:coproporphyrinogen dehydrogenase HemZ [Clostridia bacterium]
MYELITNRGDIRSDLLETVRCFLPDATASADMINFTYVKSGAVTFFVSVNEKNYVFSYSDHRCANPIERSRHDLFINKSALYRALSDYFGKRLPWGSLTGIRPTRLATRYLENGERQENIARRLQDEYFVSSAKAELTARIVREQQKTVGDRMSVSCNGLSDAQKHLANLYVHIPFCPTRCTYCSFVSEGIEKKKWLLSPYVHALIEEIKLTKEWISRAGKRIFSVYIGGGTPTVLDATLLRMVLDAAYEKHTEYTCEAGRPDTIDEEKTAVMSECGVNRISINPQTLHDTTLQKIGRAHNTQQFFEAYAMAQKYGFVKNVDLIAGLEGETEKDFCYTLDHVIGLQPENITVHTLCVKRGSHNATAETERNNHTATMVEYSATALPANGYAPYYLYRQKQMTDNLENIGWTRPDFLCVNNITVMEEMLDVYACGAGAISKAIVPGRIRRLSNPKDVLLYLQQFEERMEKKEAFFRNDFDE